MDIDLTQYIAGGYFIIKSVPRDADRSPDLLPERLISLSSECIVPAVSIYWGWHENGRAEAQQFGVSEEKLPDLRDWFNSTDKVHFPNIFFTIETAQEFVADFLEGIEHVHLLGAGLPHGLVEVFLQAHPQRTYSGQEDKFESIEVGTNAMLRTGEPLSSGGQVLGFEIVSYWQMLGHSWLCSGLERDMFEQFGIRPNKNGLINTYDEAMRVYRWIAEDEQRGHRAEPEPYYPWLLVAYPAN